MSGKIQIVVLQRGWVVVGRVTQDAEQIRVEDCSVIRRWGTTKGLGELAENGPLKSTVLDRARPVTVHQLAVVFRMDADEEKWTGQL